MAKLSNHSKDLYPIVISFSYIDIPVAIKRNSVSNSE